MSSLVERAFDFAKLDLNKDWSEKAGPGSNPLITECYKSVDGLDNPEMLDDSTTAWCSCYMNKKIQEAGGIGTRSAGAKSWLRWGREILNPRPGDIVIFKRGNSSWQGHVAFYLSMDEDYIRVLGGNQHNTVKISYYPKKDLLGFRTSKDRV